MESASVVDGASLADEEVAAVIGQLPI